MQLVLVRENIEKMMRANLLFHQIRAKKRPSLVSNTLGNSFMSINECECKEPRLWDCEDKGEYVGLDMTNSRHGEVWLYQCPNCSSNWLFYRVEYPSYSQSGRWFRAIISAEAAMNIMPQDAEVLINSSNYRVIGGSYFGSSGVIRTGPEKLPFDH